MLPPLSPTRNKGLKTSTCQHNLTNNLGGHWAVSFCVQLIMKLEGLNKREAMILQETMDRHLLVDSTRYHT
jgi:hypothetical protein